MNLAQIEYFAKTVETHSFSRAAQCLSVTQQAVSKAIANLEDELGTPLFDRSPGGLTLTAAGRRAQLRAEAILREVQLMVDEAHEGPAGLCRYVIRLAVANTVLAERYLSPIEDVAAFTSSRPLTHVEILEASCDACQALLEAGEADAAVVTGGADYARFVCRRLYEEPAVPVACVGHPLAGDDPVDLADLARETFLMPSGATACDAEACDAFYEAGVDVPCLTQFVHPDCPPQLLLEHVAAGEGVCFLGRGSIGRLGRLDAVGCVELPVRPNPFVRRLTLATRRTMAADPLLTELRSFLAALFERRCEAGAGR